LNDLEKYFNQNKEGLITKWDHYFDIYDYHFNRFRGREVHVLEFGVYQGGSLKMWKDYFGSRCKVYGVDINPHCIKAKDDNIEIFIGDQEDRVFLKALIKKIPRIDILIDDGGHRMKQQINTFEELFNHISDNGIYLCEDIHTSYRHNYGGGYKKRNSFVEYSKNFIDYINAWHSKDNKLKVSTFTRSVNSLHFYDSIIVIEKKKREEPISLESGELIIPGYESNKGFLDRLQRSIKKRTQ